MSLNFLRDYAVVDAIVDVISLSSASRICNYDYVDQNVLRAFSFPIINPDNAPGKQVLDNNSIHNLHSFLRARSQPAQHL